MATFDDFDWFLFTTVSISPLEDEWEVMLNVSTNLKKAFSSMTNEIST